MVIPRSRSSSMLSRNWSWASRALTVPVFSSSRSLSVLFPWSMCAMMEKLRRCWFSAAIGEGRGLTRRSRWHNHSPPTAAAVFGGAALLEWRLTAREHAALRSERQDLHAIRRETPVRGEHGHPLDQRLRHEHPVEWIAVVGRKLCDVHRVPELDGQDARHAQREAVGDVAVWRFRKPELAQSELDRELPD